MKPTLSINSVNFREFKTLSIVVIFATCGMLGTDIHLASLPHIMAFMHTNKTHMQQSVSIFLLGMGASMLFYGPISDRYGRKPIVIFGLLLAAIASFAAVFTTHITPFLITRLFQGIGSGVCLGLGRTIIADTLQGDRLATIGSYFSMCLSLSPLLAPALGGYIQQWLGWQANFFVLGSLLTLSLLLFAFFCPETNLHKNPDACKPKIFFSTYKHLLLHPVFIGCTLLTGIAMAANMAYATTSSFIFQTQFNLTPVAYGWLTAIAGAGSFIGKFVTPFFIKRIGGKKTLWVGLLLILLAGLALLLSVLGNIITIPLIIIPVFFTIFAQTFINPNSASRALSPHHDKRGAAGALYGSFQMLSAFVVSAAIGSLAHDGVMLLAVCYIVLGAIGLAIYAKIF